MNRRSFLKACGVGVVAPLGLVGKATEEVVPKFIEPVPVEDRVYGLIMPAGTVCIYDDDGCIVPITRQTGRFPFAGIMGSKGKFFKPGSAEPVAIHPWTLKPGKSYGD